MSPCRRRLHGEARLSLQAVHNGGGVSLNSESSQMIGLYNYRCRITRVIDGDTVDCVIDVGFGLQSTHRLRLMGINAPEVKGESKGAGHAATEHLKTLLEQSTDSDGYHLIHTEKDDAFGRYLALIYMDQSASDTVNQRMIRDGHAVEYRRK